MKKKKQNSNLKQAENKDKIDSVLKESKSMISERKPGVYRKLNSLLSVSQKLNYRYDEVLYMLSVACYQTDRLSKALQYIEESIELQKNDPDKVKVAETLSFYANILDYTGDYETALEALSKAMALQRKFKNKSSLSFTYMRMGNIYRKFLKGSDRSLIYYNKALKLSMETGNDYMIASSYGCLANAYLYKKNHTASADYYLKASAIFEKTGNRHYLATALLGLGTVYRELDKDKESADCLKKALTVIKGSHNLSLETSLSLNLAITFLKTDDVRNAMKYYNRSITLIKKVKDKTLASKLYQGFSEVYAQKNDFEKAYSHFKKYHDLYSEIFREESDRVNKILKLKLEKEKSEKEAEIYKLKTRELQYEIEMKTKELNAMASYLSQKNEFVKNLVENVKSDFSELKLEEKIGSFIGKAVKKAESASSINDDLKRFEGELDKFSFEFIEKLSKKYASLTRVELKICSMIKINLSTKEIANLLYLSVRTVENHKYRIAKKLKIKPSQNFITFLNSI